MKISHSLQRTLLNEVADRQFTVEHWVSGRWLRSRIVADELGVVEQALASLVPLSLRHTVGNRGDVYTMTLEGLHETNWKERAAVFVERLLEFLRSRFEEDPDFRRYTWQEVMEACGCDGSRFQFADEIIQIGALRDGGGGVREASGFAWCSPSDIERLSKVVDFEEFLAYRRQEERAT